MRPRPPLRSLLAATLAVSVLGCPADPVVPDAPAPPYSEARAVLGLRLEGGPIVLPRGESLQLRLDASLQEIDEPRDVTAVATFAVTDPTIATVDAAGLLLGVAEGVTSVWGLYGGLPSDPVRVEVVRGRWTAEVSAGATGVQGKLLDVEISSLDTVFAGASVALSIAGLLPFGEDRVVEPFWGVPVGEPSRYRARFLVPPTASLGDHAVTVTLDGRAPELPVSVQITANSAFGEVRGCDYFATDNASDWTFGSVGNSARTWVVGGLLSDTNTHLSAGGPGGINAWLALWSTTGTLLRTSDDDPAGQDGSAAVQITSREDVIEGAYYLTATVSPTAVGDLGSGTLLTDCASEEMAGPAVFADHDATLFGALGTDISAGSSTPVATFTVSGRSGIVTRAWLVLDATITNADFVTFTLRSPAGTEVEIVSPNWSADWLAEDGELAIALGGPSPFFPTADEWVNPSTGVGTLAFAGQSANGVWTVAVTMNAAGLGGTWRDAALYVDTE